MDRKIPGAAVAAALVSLALTACDQSTVDAANRDAARAGQKLEKALDKTQQKLAEVGREAKQQLAEAGRETKITIGKAGDKLAAGTDRVVKDVKDSAKDAASPQGSRTNGSNAVADTARVTSDVAITASIKADLIKDPDLSVLKIDVDTVNGVVTLNGLADNDAARERATQMARAVKGVKEVRNFLVTKKA